MGYKNVIFDLDGTLIDSAVGIEYSFYLAYEAIYGKKCDLIIRHLIGPPIDQLLVTVKNEKDKTIINEFVAKFKENYDAIGYKKSTLYEYVYEGLNDLYDEKKILFIATNKRAKPTRLILDYLKISHLFKKIYAPDSRTKTGISKSEMVSNLMRENRLKPKETVFVGDTIHDAIASNENEIDFVLAQYGYGEFEEYKYKIFFFKDLLDLI